MSSLKTPNPPDPKDIAERESLERAARRIQEEPDLRKWRDEYLTGMQNHMALEVIELVLKATDMDGLMEAKATAIARGKIGDMQRAMVTMAENR